jgi:hypothetical protein
MRRGESGCFGARSFLQKERGLADEGPTAGAGAVGGSSPSARRLVRFVAVQAWVLWFGEQHRSASIISRRGQGKGCLAADGGPGGMQRPAGLLGLSAHRRSVAGIPRAKLTEILLLTITNSQATR